MRNVQRQALEVGPPLPRAYSHRDCELKPPLARSLEQGFAHVEVDVFCMAGRIIVAHELRQLRAQNTLRKLYLAPLRAHASRHDGRIFTDDTQLWLFIDMKTAAQAGFRALLRVIENHADLVTSAPPGSNDGKPVRIVLSGNRPAPAEVAALPRRWLTLDGRIEDLGVFTDPTVMPVISDDWRKLFNWRGEGPMPEEEAARLADMVRTAHANAQMLRFWGTPEADGVERERVWAHLLEAGIDLISTDDVTSSAEVTSARVRQFKIVGSMHQRSQEHDDASRSARCLDINRRKVQFRRHDEFQIVVVSEPCGLDSDRDQDLQEPIDFLDASNFAKHCGARIEQRGTEQSNARVLAGLDVNRTRERRATGHSQMARS